MKRLSLVLAASLLALTVSTVSMAVHVPPDYSRTWDGQEALDAGARGSILSMDITNINTVSDPLWHVVMYLDTTNYFGADPLDLDPLNRIGFNQIGFGAIQHWDPSDVVPFNPTLVSVTSPSSVNLSGDWHDAVTGAVSSGINGPCDPSPINVFKVCTEGYSNINTDRGLYAWVFEIVGGEVQATDEWHWGGQYSDLGTEGRTSGWIISTEGIIPEPSAALVFAIGFGVISAAQRKR